MPAISNVVARTERSARRWFAACCRTREENKAKKNLLEQGFLIYLPIVHVRLRRDRRWFDAVEPLFPGYLFVRFDPSVRSASPIRSTRGVIGLVRFGGEPAVVPDDVVDALRKREGLDGIHDDPDLRFVEGDRVELLEGPFTGMIGALIGRAGAHRVSVLLEALGQTHRLNVSSDWIAHAA